MTWCASKLHWTKVTDPLCDFALYIYTRVGLRTLPPARKKKKKSCFALAMDRLTELDRASSEPSERRSVVSFSRGEAKVDLGAAASCLPELRVINALGAMQLRSLCDLHGRAVKTPRVLSTLSAENQRSDRRSVASLPLDKSFDANAAALGDVFLFPLKFSFGQFSIPRPIHNNARAHKSHYTRYFCLFLLLLRLNNN